MIVWYFVFNLKNIQNTASETEQTEYLDDIFVWKDAKIVVLSNHYLYIALRRRFHKEFGHVNIC